MAGSISDFKYLDDRNQAYLVRIDKSNALKNGTGFVPLTQADLALDFLPRNIELRYVKVRHPSRPIDRYIYCASLLAPLWLGTQKTIILTDYQDNSQQDFNVISREFERKTYTAKLTDTYQTG